jgi:LacI family transcriptional regulator
MSDVARLAGVGVMTVSRVLSGAVRVSPESTQRVQSAVEQLQYRPNVLARAFREQRSHSIGLILPYLYDPFFSTCAHAVTSLARKNGYSVIISTSDEDPQTELAETEQMLQRHVDGVLVIPSRCEESRLTRALFGKTPVVAFDRPVPDPSIDSVLVQNSIGTRRMVQHLIEHGHKRIAYIGLSQSLFTINKRFLGYRRAMHDAGFQADPVFDCTSEEIALEILKAKLGGNDSPTAILTSNTLVTRYVLSAISRLNLRVPNDLALAGFDDFDLAKFTAPPLTVVRQAAEEMGRVAASLLFNRIARDESPRTGQKIVLPVEIVLRRSCGCKHRSPVVIQ